MARPYKPPTGRSKAPGWRDLTSKTPSWQVKVCAKPKRKAGGRNA